MKMIHFITINRLGWVTCGEGEYSRVCYKWRSKLACKDCPMQKLMQRSQLNEAAFSPYEE